MKRRQPEALATFDPTQQPRPSQILVLLGSAGELHPFVLESLFIRAARNERVGVIIGDNRFDAFALARRARVQGFDPTLLLKCIKLPREYTCYQVHHCLATLAQKKMHDWSALYVLGYLATFYDEDVKYADARRLVIEGLVHLKQIASAGLTVLVTLAPPRERGREDFVELVLRAVDAYWVPPPSIITQVAQQLSFVMPSNQAMDHSR